jgi:hypothetical protein
MVAPDWENHGSPRIVVAQRMFSSDWRSTIARGSGTFPLCVALEIKSCALQVSSACAQFGARDITSAESLLSIAKMGSENGVHENPLTFG